MGRWGRHAGSNRSAARSAGRPKADVRELREELAISAKIAYSSMALTPDTLVVAGPPDVGKSSLIAAGLLPELERQGTFAIRMEDYPRAVDFVRDGLLRYSELKELGLDEAMTLPQMVQGHDPQGHILHQGVRKRPYAGQGRLGRAVVLGHEEQDDPGTSEGDPP